MYYMDIIRDQGCPDLFGPVSTGPTGPKIRMGREIVWLYRFLVRKSQSGLIRLRKTQLVGRPIMLRSSFLLFIYVIHFYLNFIINFG